jgi:hypothetical protein
VFEKLLLITNSTLFEKFKPFGEALVGPVIKTANPFATVRIGGPRLALTNRFPLLEVWDAHFPTKQKTSKL